MNPTPDTLLLLPGLREDNPRDFLAAAGFLRLLSLALPAHQPRLAWDLARGHPVLHTCEPLPAEWSATVTRDLQALAEPKDSPLFHGAVIKAESQVFRAAAQRAQRLAVAPAQPLAALAPLLYAAYSSQADQDGEVQATLFSFANGQGGKNLLLDVRSLLLDCEAEDLQQAVTGQAAPRDAKSFRWHPAEYRSAAYRSHDPGKAVKGDNTLDIPVLNVLAFLGLTFFPCVPTLDGGRTVGMHRDEQGWRFTWPIWEAPLSADSLAFLVAQPAASLGVARGVPRTWISRRFVSDKSVYFSPARLLT